MLRGGWSALRRMVSKARFPQTLQPRHATIHAVKWLRSRYGQRCTLAGFFSVWPADRPNNFALRVGAATSFFAIRLALIRGAAGFVSLASVFVTSGADDVALPRASPLILVSLADCRRSFWSDRPAASLSSVPPEKSPDPPSSRGDAASREPVAQSTSISHAP
jgi:hypothetical protein